MGIISLIGPTNTIAFFTKKSKIMGSACYFAGMTMIIVGWKFFTIIGFSLQMYGILLLFHGFLKTIFAYVQTLPVVGPMFRDSPWVHKIVNTISNFGTTNKGDYSAKKFEV